MKTSVAERVLPMVSFAALVVVTALLAVHPERAVTEDGVEYLGLAENIAVHHAFLSYYFPGTPELYRTPLYPLFFAATGAWESLSRLRLAIALQGIMGLATAIAIGLAAHLQGCRSPRLVGALYLASPIVLIYTNHLGTEAPFGLLAACAALLLVRGTRTHPRTGEHSLVRGRSLHTMPWIFASGLLAGLATLARPIGAVFLFEGIVAMVVAFFAADRKRVLRLALVWLLAAGLLPALWAWRNGRVGDFWGVSKTGPSYVSSVLGQDYLVEGIEGMKTSVFEEKGLRAAAGDVVRAVGHHPWPVVRTLLVGSGRTMFGPGEWGIRRHLLGEAGFRSAITPASLYSITPGRGRLVFAKRAIIDPAKKRSLACILALAWSIGAMIAVYAWVLAGVRALGRRNTLAILWMGAAALLLLASAGYLSNSRFRLPVIPFLLLLGSAGRRSADGRKSITERGSITGPPTITGSPTVTGPPTVTGGPTITGRPAIIGRPPITDPPAQPRSSCTT